MHCYSPIRPDPENVRRGERENLLSRSHGLTVSSSPFLNLSALLGGASAAARRSVFIAFWLAAALFGRAAAISEDFAANPTQHGWRVFGDASLFHWNATHQNLEVTWDSSHTNSFFYLPLGTVLAKSDDFSFSFDLRLSDIRVGSTLGKSNEFEIAIGLLNYRTATNSKAFRAAGVSSSYGVRNIVEFDY